MRSICLAGMVLLAGCAAQAPLRPVTDPDMRLEFHGFSVLPPPGAHWYFGAQSPYEVTLGKGDPALVAELQTFLVNARIFDAEGAKIDTPEALSEAFQQRYLTTLPGGRLRLVESKADPYRAHGTDCIRYHVVLEERDHPRAPGALLILADRGFQCRHPNSPRHVVHLVYSARHVQGRPSPLEADVTREAEAFLRSVQFVPLSQRFDETVNCVSDGRRQWTRKSKCD